MSALAVSRSAKGGTAFPVALNWFAVGDHCAYYVALERGYYAKAGLNVTFETSKGSGDSTAKVAAGNVCVAIGEAAGMMAALARGAPLRAVGAIFDRTPLNIFSRDDLPARVPKDLVGHTIGAPPGDGQRQIWPAFAKANGLATDQATWVNIEPTAKPAALTTKRVDFIADYITGRPLYAKALGSARVVSMPWSSFGIDIYSLMFATTREMIERRSGDLRGFLAASYQGWSDVMIDPEGSLEIFKKHVPELDLSFIRPNMQIGVDLLRTETFASHGLGWIDPGKMKATVDVVNTYLGLSKKMDVDDVYTNDLLTKVPLPLTPT